MFLPIKGPGGRYLTPREKVALLILGITLVLSVLTILQGEHAYLSDQSRNPVFGLVSLLCRKFGGGIIALYALVLVWSGLIYFKGEKIARVTPLSGRVFAALAVTVGVSGALGIAKLETAGGLGSVVGGALGRTFGGGVGFPMLLALMLLGLHLAGQGAWAAMREPMPAGARPAGGGFGLDAPGRRVSGMTFVDDGDPTADERTLAVTQAMEEIERRQGVTIVEVDERPSIGEEVADAPPPPPESEESSVREGLAVVEDLLEVADARPAPEAWAVETEVQEEPPGRPEEEYETEEHGLVPVPPAESPAAAWQIAPAPRAEEGVSAGEEAGETAETREVADVGDQDAAEAPAAVVEEEGEVEEQQEPPQADGYADEDPYAQGGLLRRIQEKASDPPAESNVDEERPFTTFDWRGRPLS
jgi:hypothetical protein